jgi:hypothetical protein
VRNPIDLALFEGILYWLKAGTGELTSYKPYGPHMRRIGKLQLYLYNTEHFAILQSSAQPRGKVFMELNGLELDSCGWCVQYGFPSILCLKCHNTEDLKHNWYNIWLWYMTCSKYLWMFSPLMSTSLTWIILTNICAIIHYFSGSLVNHYVVYPEVVDGRLAVNVLNMQSANNRWPYTRGLRWS